MPYQPRVHIRDERFPSRAICGLVWTKAEHGGRVASSTSPPVVVNDESGSVNPATCLQCLSLFRESLRKKQKPG